MKIIHSFSTIPFQKKHDDILDMWKNVLLYATSTAYVHNVLHLPITLYVNSEGKKFFDFIPYDNIVEMEPDETINDIFWASYKMQALQKSEKDSIHIDGDVFILDKNLGDIIKNNDKYDILVQSIDCKDKTTSTYIKTFISYFENLKFLKKYCPNFDTEIFDTNNFDFTNSLNTGVLGFSHDDMKQEWCI